MNPVDAQQRKDALDPQGSFIVQAPAGSGKTELLIQRYLKLLACVEAPEQIVAITFTRKAAAEMQSRVLRAIEQAQKGEQPVSEHQQLTLSLASAALARNDKLGWNISQHPQRLRIQTIDSLCSSLTRQMPVLSGLGGQAETIDDARELYDAAAVATLAALETDERWSDAIASLLIHLDNNLPRIKQLIIEMLAKRDQWLRYVTQGHNRQDMESTLQIIIHEHLQHLQQLWPETQVTELCALLRYSAENLAEENSGQKPASTAELNELPGTEADDLEQWLNICDILLTKDRNKPNWRKRIDKNIGFPPASGNKLLAEHRQSMKERLKVLIQALQNIPGLRESLIAVRELPAAHYHDREWDMVEALTELLILAVANLRVIFSERNLIDFSGLAESAITALGDNEAPTDLALHLDFQIQHLLIDEFQDISINQYELLQRLTASWMPDDGKSLFLVGDPMQSIYRFREAEVALFIKTWQQQSLGQIPLETLQLKLNFRSSALIVDWLNSAFKDMMPPEDDPEQAAVKFTGSAAGTDIHYADAVNVYPSFTNDGIDEAGMLGRTIQKLCKEDTDSSIAILVRSRAHLVEILPVLRDMQISFTAVEIEPLMNRMVIQDLLSLTRAYAFAADRIAWLSILRAPWCGLTLESLSILFSKEDKRTVLQTLSDEALVNKLHIQEQKRLNHLLRIFNHALHSRQKRSLRNSIESLWLNLGGPATLEQASDLQNASDFFEVLDQVEQGFDLKDQQNLLRALETLYASPDASAGSQVQVMSMHKAKGLEFDHVFLPGLGKRPRNQDPELLRWTMNLADDNARLIVAPIREAGQDEGSIYRYLSRLEKAKQKYENVRLLYVAATRARKSLHLFGHAKYHYEPHDDPSCSPENNSLLASLWEIVKHDFHKAMQSYKEMEPEESLQQEAYLLRLKDDWKQPQLPTETLELHDIAGTASSGSSIEFEWAGETIKHVGTTVHRFIQDFAEQGANMPGRENLPAMHESVVKYLVQLGVSEADTAQASQQVLMALENILNDERGRWILSADHKMAANEFPLSGIIDKQLVNVRIDRTFVDDTDTRWIIDYKTSRHDEPDVDSFLDEQQQRYQTQLMNYARLFSGVENRKIRLGLYFPLLCGWREWSA